MQAYNYLNSKIILTWDDLQVLMNKWKQKSSKIVFTNGCFDVIHKGHIEYLSRASDLGSKLIIGLNSDSSVKKLKGKGRPINDEISRAKVLASMFFVDAVCFFSQDTPIELIKIVMPDVLVKGGDYQPKDIVGYDLVSDNGGKVVSLDYIDGFSSSDIIEKLKQLK